MYDRKLNGKPHTFVVSGKLWNRSLAMMDQETGSLWSHILGLCMEGKLKDTELTALPADMVTWAAWKREHPKTTVLKMSRTNRRFKNDFYKQPERFVIGFRGKTGFFHRSFTTMKARPLLNIDAGGKQLMILFNPESTSARIYSRQLGERELTFTVNDKSQLQDKQTGSIWNHGGTAIEGPLKGKQLQPHVGIVSFTRAWKTFHPESKEVQPSKSVNSRG